MKIHEYQAKSIFKKYGIPIPRGDVATDPEKAFLIAKTISRIFIEKSYSSQINGLEETIDFSAERLAYYQK